MNEFYDEFVFNEPTEYMYQLYPLKWAMNGVLTQRWWRPWRSRNCRPSRFIGRRSTRARRYPLSCRRRTISMESWFVRVDDEPNGKEPMTSWSIMRFGRSTWSNNSRRSRTSWVCKLVRCLKKQAKDTGDLTWGKHPCCSRWYRQWFHKCQEPKRKSEQ